MKKIRLLAMLAGVLPWLAACDNESFESFDKNHDGRIVSDEVSPALRDELALADTNDDGAVSKDEFGAFLKAKESTHFRGRFEVIEDIAYAGTTNPMQTLDLILPKKRDAKIPLIVYIHGGGWVQGDKSRGRLMLIPFLRDGLYAGASLNYRLSNEARWPAQIHDCKAAVRWLRANASKYGIDPDRIAVWGNSAGGHLTSMIGLTSGSPELDGTLGKYSGTSSRPQCAIVYCGPSDFPAMVNVTNSFDHGSTNCAEALLLGGPLRQKMDLARSASPVTYASPDAPPFLIAQGDKDTIVPFHQSELLTAALTKAGARTAPIFIKIVGADHVFISRELLHRTRQFLDMYLYDQRSEISSSPIRGGDE